MTLIDDVGTIAESFEFKKGDYLGAEEQLSKFAENYLELSAAEADQLRCGFDAKERLGLLGAATSVFQKSFLSAEILRKDKLCMILFACYSFDNMEFGCDSLRHIMPVLGDLEDYQELAHKNWLPFRRLTSNEIARKNLENRLFSDYI